MLNKKLLRRSAGRVLALALAASLAFPGTALAASQDAENAAAKEEIYVEETAGNQEVSNSAAFAATYTVKYDLNGGKLSSDAYEYVKDKITNGETVDADDYFALPGNSSFFVRDGYRFVGWTTAKNSGTIYETYDEYPLTGNTTFYAYWERQYTIKFNANGGKFESSYYGQDRTVKAGESTYLSDGTYVATRSGYLMDGWTEKGSSKVLTDEYTPTKDVTLYVHWVKAYTIKYNANGGKFSSTYYSQDRVVKAGSAYWLSVGDYVATKKGYIMDGWTAKKGAKKLVSESYKPTKNITLYAHWVKAVTVTFNAGKGYFLEDGKKVKKITKKFPKGDTFGQHNGSNNLLNSSAKASFLGWYKDSKLKKHMKKSDVLKKNITVYAKWTTKSHKITVTGLKGASYTNKNTNTYVSSDKSTADSYSYYVKKGSSIGGIYADKSDKDVQFYFDKNKKTQPFYSSYVPTKNLTVYAKWRDEVTVKWDGNGGESYYDGASGEVSSTKTLMCEMLPDRNDMYRAGYWFAGWCDVKKPTKVLPVSHVFNADTTVKAKWIKGVKITFKAGGGEFYENARTVKYARKNKTLDSSEVYAPYVSRKGYVLKGWKNSVTKKVVTNLYKQKPKKATTYTAVWVKESKSDTVAVTLTAGAGSLYNSDTGKYVTKLVVRVPKNMTYADALKTLNSSSHDDPLKNLYNAGWSLKKGGKELNASYRFTKKVTLYPVWKPGTRIRIAMVTNGGSLYNYPQNDPSVTSVTSKGTTITLPTAKDMEREGYKFVGWYTDFACKKKVSKPSAYKATKTCYLYAKWKKK